MVPIWALARPPRGTRPILASDGSARSVRDTRRREARPETTGTPTRVPSRARRVSGRVSGRGSGGCLERRARFAGWRENAAHARERKCSLSFAHNETTKRRVRSARARWRGPRRRRRGAVDGARQWRTSPWRRLRRRRRHRGMRRGRDESRPTTRGSRIRGPPSRETEAPRRGRVPRRPPPHRARAAPRTSPRTLRRLLERSAAAARAGTPPGTRTRSRPARSCPLRREHTSRLRVRPSRDAIRSSISMSIRQKKQPTRSRRTRLRTPARCCFPEACSRSSPCRSCASATRRRTPTRRRAARLRRSRESTAPRSKGLKLKKMRLDALFFPRLPRLPRLTRRAARRRPSRYTAEMALA